MNRPLLYTAVALVTVGSITSISKSVSTPDPTDIAVQQAYENINILEHSRSQTMDVDLYHCSLNYYNCSDLTSQAEAQKVFEACGGAINDIHKLDADHDGIACESLR
ncbi:MAG: hypothetical protein JWN50_687 [Parcubacteria group bacterium]|nr:hypothetical protein [Parcubacteria group bacterium]